MNLSTENLAVLKKAIQEGVDCKLQEAAAKDLLSSIIDTTKEKLGGKECELDIRGMITKAYDRTYDLVKFDKNKQKIEDVYEILEEIK